MSLEPEMLKSLVKAAAEQVIASAAELTALDQAIGDGDHGANMKRGFEAVLGKLDTIAALPPGEALKTIGKTLVMTVGGAVRSALRKLLSRGRRCLGEQTIARRSGGRVRQRRQRGQFARAFDRPAKRPCSMFCSRCWRR